MDHHTDEAAKNAPYVPPEVIEYGDADALTKGAGVGGGALDAPLYSS